MRAMPCFAKWLAGPIGAADPDRRELLRSMRPAARASRQGLRLCDARFHARRRRDRMDAGGGHPPARPRGASSRTHATRPAAARRRA